MDANPKHIYLTDDDQDDCMLFSEALQEIDPETGLKVTTNGTELMDLLEDEEMSKPDVIFLDLNMPLKNGFECLNAIRETPEYDDIPIVIYSTSSNQDVIEKTFIDGANYYICKPASYQALKGTIRKVLALGIQELKRRPARENFVITI